jgi:uncharacterized protein YndB with AHSA1/START domain
MSDIRRISDLYFFGNGLDRTLAHKGSERRYKVAIRCVVGAPAQENQPNTVRLHRVLATKPDKVYRAFIEADAKAKWLPPNGFACTVHHLDAKVGGTYRMSFRNFTTGKSHSFGGKYLELVPGERLRYSDRFEDPNLPGEMQVTVALKQVSVGTELTIVQEGIPDAIPVEACYLGWQDSLRNLASLVEPEINQ